MGSRPEEKPLQDVDEELASINAQLRTRRNPAQTLRRSMESVLEGRAKKERKRQKPASANFKRVSGS